MTDDGSSSASDPRRARVYVAAVLGLGLAAAVAAVLLTGSGEGGTATAADPACIEAWNGDPEAVGFGEHQFNGHGYDRVEVLRVTESGTPTESEDGLCAVVFAATALDPEPGARAQVRRDARWEGFESLPRVDERAIGQLQSDAVAGANASLTGDGRLVPTG